MKKLLAIFALSASISAAFAQNDLRSTSTTTTVQSGSLLPMGVELGSFMTQNNLSWEDAAAAIALARATGMSPTEILAGRGAATGSYYDLAPAYWIARNTSQPVSTILNMYGSGQSWMDIARNTNLANWLFNPDQADTSAWTNTDFTNAVWRNILSTHFAMSPTDYTTYSGMNVPWNQFVVAEVWGLETGQPLSDIWTTYSQNGNSWTTVQTNYARYIPVQQTTTTLNQSTSSGASERFQESTTIRTQTTHTETEVAPARAVRTQTTKRTVKSHPVRRHRVAHRRTRKSGRAMRMVRRHRQKQCICTCPEHRNRGTGKHHGMHRTKK